MKIIIDIAEKDEERVVNGLDEIFQRPREPATGDYTVTTFNVIEMTDEEWIKYCIINFLNSSTIKGEHKKSIKNLIKNKEKFDIS